MTKIIFVCSGNICRSPMAEFIMKHLVKQAEKEKNFLGVVGKLKMNNKSNE